MNQDSDDKAPRMLDRRAWLSRSTLGLAARDVWVAWDC